MNATLFHFGIQLPEKSSLATLLKVDFGGSDFAYWGHDKHPPPFSFFAAPLGASCVVSVENKCDESAHPQGARRALEIGRRQGAGRSVLNPIRLYHIDL